MFDSIIGQEQAVKNLERALAHPVNTYVFYGSRGTYVEQAARIFAAHLIDASGQIDDRVSKQLYSDVIEFEPMGTAYRVKEDVRESMLGEMRKSPIEGKRKVLIVHDAHLLRADSANTMLKSLEEPPDNMFWILIAPSKESLIATIRSRSYEIEFSRLSEKHIEKVLIDNGVNPEKAEEVSKVSSGRLDRAMNLATFLAPLKNCAYDIVSNQTNYAAHATSSAKKIVETFDEIASDVVAKNKLESENIKKEMKDSGYSDKISNGIISATKKRLEAKEKRLRHELLEEFLDALAQAYLDTNSLASVEIITEYRKRLVFNPAELLFLESLLASISLNKTKVNS